jgi:hypothetical protein
MAADLPRNYAAKLDLFQFIKDVPADWEESLPAGRLKLASTWFTHVRSGAQTIGLLAALRMKMHGP